jgi:hypothetical protein
MPNGNVIWQTSTPGDITYSYNSDGTLATVSFTVRLNQPDVSSESVLHDSRGADFGRAVVRRDF